MQCIANERLQAMSLLVVIRHLWDVMGIIKEPYITKVIAARVMVQDMQIPTLWKC